MDIHWFLAERKWSECGVLAEARAEPHRQGASEDREDRRPRAAIQPQASSGGSAGRQAGTCNLDEPDTQGRWLCVGTINLYSLEMKTRYMGVALLQFSIRHIHWD